MPRMDEEALKAILAAESAAALGGGDTSDLAHQRTTAIDYYLGEMDDMPAPPGRSRAVSTDVADTVDGIMPSLMDIFTAGDEVARFDPVGPEDEAAAVQETDYINHVFYQENAGFSVLHAMIKDALIQKNGIVKFWWGRSQGRYASTGSANAYLLTLDVPLAAYVVGERYSFRASFANTGGATLNISGLGAKTLKKITASGKANVAAGDIQSGQPVTAEYDGTDMVVTTPLATTSFDTIPPGAIIAFGGATAPSGWLLCDGSAVSRTTFAALFAAVSTAYGAGDGSTTFNVPDLRGRTTVGKDDIGGSAANRLQVSTTINTTNSSTSATVASAANLAIGMFVVSANVPAGTTITAINGTTVTLSAAASATATGTAARFSLLTDAQSLGAGGGSQVHTLVTAQMPAHTHTYNDWNSPGTGTVGPGSNFASGVQTGSTGAGQAHPNLQPSLITSFIIKF